MQTWSFESGMNRNRDVSTSQGTRSGAIRWIAGSSGHAFAVIFALSFLLRAGFLLIVPAQYFLPDSGWEVGAVAQSLVTTGRFADPYSLPTGPTAHPAPIYPVMLSLIYRIFGITPAAGYASWILSLASTSVMLGLLPWFAGKFGLPRKAGIIGGIVGALLPRWPAQVEALAAIVLGLLLTAFVTRWTKGRTAPLASFSVGIAAGVFLHLQPALLPVLLACLAFELWWSKGRRRWLCSFLVICGLVTACIPWTWRNYETFHKFIFIRSNLGLELRLANSVGATVERTTTRHPRISMEEAQKVKELGEPEYMRQAENEALAWMSSHPGAFMWLTVRRFAYFWFGPLDRPLAALPTLAITVLAILGVCKFFRRLTMPQRAALAIPLLTYPMIYYLVCYVDRYRVPIEWILLLLSGAALTPDQFWFVTPVRSSLRRSHHLG